MTSLEGLTIEQIAEEVRRQDAARSAGPTNAADIALKNAHMDISRVFVPYQRHEYPKVLYQLQPAKGKRVEKVLTHLVHSQKQEESALSDGWQLESIAVEPKEEDAPELPSELLAKLLKSTEPVALPVGRLAKPKGGLPKATAHD